MKTKRDNYSNFLIRTSYNHKHQLNSCYYIIQEDQASMSSIPMVLFVTKHQLLHTALDRHFLARTPLALRSRQHSYNMACIILLSLSGKVTNVRRIKYSVKLFIIDILYQKSPSLSLHRLKPPRIIRCNSLYDT